MPGPKILLVDDEPNVLQGLSLLLGRQFTVLTAASGAAGLEKLAADNSIAVIVSDMRMPGMNGAEFLAQAHRQAPATVRMLLTGQSDIKSAIAAVNEGQIFRFLTKPTAPEALLKALDAAVRQHRLLHAEKELLEQTLRGSIQALTDVLSLANPGLFGRATRIKGVVKALQGKLALGDHWQIDVATMLLPLAQVSLPPETAESVARGAELSEEERAMVARLPEITDSLLAHIPRLEAVRVLLAHVQQPYRQAMCIQPPEDAPVVLLGKQLLLVAIAFDTLTQGGMSAADAVGVMRAQTHRFDTKVVAAIAELYAGNMDERRVVEISVKGLAAGMMLAEDLSTRNGLLLVPQGCEVTAASVERIRNFRPETLKETVRIVVGAS